MKKFFKSLTRTNKGEKGFTLIELLIVIAILGILAAVAIPNVASFIASGKVSAANSELANVQTANQAWAADHDGTFSTGSAALVSGSYFNGTITASYTFDPETGAITAVDDGWDPLTYDGSTNKFKK